MAVVEVDVTVTYLIINNIPKSYHAADLRNFFSQFVETGGFQCFHFRHRPEVQQVRNNDDGATSNQDEEADQEVKVHKTTCCIIRVPNDRVAELMKMYDKKHWVDRQGHTLTSKCLINRFKIDSSGDTTSEGLSKVYRTRGERKVASDQRTLRLTELKKFPELHPPSVMPNGNVGTLTTVFLKMINSCRLPPFLIKKLGLEFPQTKARRIYSCVPFNYKTGRKFRGDSESEEMIQTGKGDPIVLNICDDKSAKKAFPEEEDVQKEHNDFECEHEREESDDDEECEEWDRHASLHNDITQQERSREKLFEDEIELQWEKGGSGLVFYTDAQFWDAKEGDFDAKTSDDWDIDTSVYYNPDAGDKDARDLLSMREMQKLREEEEFSDPNRIGLFEQHTKGFGRRIMEKQGWTDGEGLGKTIPGISEPIDDSGKHPWDKTGFGYRGKKLQRTFPSKRKRNASDVIISTVYDNVSETDPPEPFLRSNENTHLKFRKAFIKGSHS